MRPAVWAIVIAMGVSNYAIRLLPTAILARIELPRPVERWLSYIPASVLATIVAVEVLRPSGEWAAPLANPRLFAAIPTAFVYARTRSFIVATVAGVFFYMLFRVILG